MSFPQKISELMPLSFSSTSSASGLRREICPLCQLQNSTGQDIHGFRGWQNRTVSLRTNICMPSNCCLEYLHLKSMVRCDNVSAKHILTFYNNSYRYPRKDQRLSREGYGGNYNFKKSPCCISESRTGYFSAAEEQRVHKYQTEEQECKRCADYLV